MATETVFYNNKKLVGIGSVGIGTTAPSRPFEVQSGDVSIGGGTINTIPGQGLGPKLMIASDVSLVDTYAGDARAQLMLTGSSNTNKRLALMYDTSNNFGLIQSQEYSIGPKPLILNLAGGNVGIGTSNPSTVFHIAGDTPVLALQTTSAVTGHDPAFILYDSVKSAKGAIGWSVVGDYAYWFSDTVNRQIIIYDTTSPYGTGIQLVGNVGIGTANPSTNFHVHGSTGVSTRTTCSGTTGSAGFILNGGNTGDFFIYQYGSGYTGGEKPATWTVMRNDAGPITIQSTSGYGNYAGVNIVSNNVGIGTSNPVDWFGSTSQFSIYSPNNAGAALNVDSGAKTGGDTITMIKRYTSNYIIRMDSTPNVYNALFIYFATNGGASNPGTIQATNSTTMLYGSTSDYRIKSNVVPLANSIEFIDKLRPVNFTFNERPNEIVAGFIAHELQEFIPQAVSGVKDDVDDNGNMRTQNVDVSFVVPYLTAAVKDLVTQNTDLKSQLQTAQNDIDLLESRLAAIEALISTNTSADVTTVSTGTRSDALLAEAGAV